MLVVSAQVKSEYAKLKETLGAVTQERDLALWERNQLQDKLENLEQVLKVRTPAPRPHCLSALRAFLAPVVRLSWDPNSGVFMEPNPLPVPLLLPVPPSGSLQLYCLMSLTCLLPSSVVLGGLTRSCERVEAWSSLPPFPLLFRPFMLSHPP